MLKSSFKIVAVWLGILLLAITNGALRETLLIPALGGTLGHFLSGVLLCGFILAVTFFVLPWFGPVSTPTYITIGLVWLCLTLVFEFMFGHLIQGKSWPQLLEAYRFSGGNIWPIVLFVTVVAPAVAARIRAWV